MHRSRNSALGVTLLELMLAMSMSLMLVSSVMVIYLTLQKNHQLLSAMNELQESSRTAAQLLREHIQVAGYSGCARREDKISRMIGTDETLTTSQAGTQSAEVSFSDSMQVIVAAKPSFNAGDSAFISDCQAAEIFSIKKVLHLANGSQKLLLLQPLKHSYAAHAEVSHWNELTYFVKKTLRFRQKGEAISALYVKNADKPAQEWVAGVDAMQIRYAVRSQDRLLVVAASQVDDWSAVVGVQIKLGLSATQNVDLHKTAYVYIALRQAI